MYREHFKLKERPFIQAPGQRFFAANAGMTDALAHLQHVLTARDSVAVVTGGPGVGKSTIAECAVAAIPEGAMTARVDLRYGDGEDLYAAILLSLREEATGMRPVQALQALREVMARFTREERRLVLLLDIGGISADIAKHLLRVVNLAGELNCQMNMILMGPHPLHQQTDIPALIHLRQRIKFRHRVRPFTLAETDRYIRHQLDAVGADPSMLLAGNVSAAVYCYVAGVPRLINTLLDAALSDACLQHLQRPDSGVIKRTADGLGWKPMTPAQSAPESGQKAANAPVRAAPLRSSPPKVAIVASNTRAPTGGIGTAEPRRTDHPAPSEATLRLRGDAAVEAGKFGGVSLAAEQKSPTAAVFGAGNSAAQSLPPPVVAMDEMDTGATGMLRLQDLDDRFAETIFGKEAEDAAPKPG